MKNILCGLILPLFVFSFVFSGCKKTSDLSNKTTVLVNCVRNNTNPAAEAIGTEVVLSRTSDGLLYKTFTMVPATVRFDEVEPGTYKIEGKSSNSLYSKTVEIEKNKEHKVSLMFD